MIVPWVAQRQARQVVNLRSENTGLNYLPARWEEPYAETLDHSYVDGVPDHQGFAEFDPCRPPCGSCEFNRIYEKENDRFFRNKIKMK